MKLLTRESSHHILFLSLDYTSLTALLNEVVGKFQREPLSSKQEENEPKSWNYICKFWVGAKEGNHVACKGEGRIGKWCQAAAFCSSVLRRAGVLSGASATQPPVYLGRGLGRDSGANGNWSEYLRLDFPSLISIIVKWHLWHSCGSQEARINNSESWNQERTGIQKGPSVTKG